MNSNPINEEPILRQVHSHTELCTATHSTCPATCFINNLTQNEQKLLHNPPYTLATSYDSILNPIRKRRNNSNKRNLPPRPQNGWILFRRNFQSQVLSGSPGKSSALNEISQEAAKSWKNQPKEVKEYFKVLSKLASYKHKAMYPEYVYNPRKFKNGESFIFKNMDKDKFVKNGSSNASTSKKAKKSNNLSEGDHIGVMRNEDYSEINDEQQSILPSTFIDVDFPNWSSDFYDFSMLSPENNDRQQYIVPTTFIDFPSLFPDFYNFPVLSPNSIQRSSFFPQRQFYNDFNNDNINEQTYTNYGFESYSA